MIARIRLRRGRPIQRRRGKNRHVALAFAALLVPASLMAYVLGFWRLLADMGIVGQFAITGVFSHWQIWIAVGVSLHLVAYSLNRYGRGGDLEIPRFLSIRTFLGRPAPEPDAAVPQRKVSAR
jgi:hypothetical protein